MNRLKIAAMLRAAGDRQAHAMDFVGADLCDADLSGARLMFVNLAHARLAGANLTGARLTNVVLTSADLCEAVLSGAELSLVEATDADFSRSDGSRSVWRHGNLLHAKFDTANLTRARFGNCTLESVSFAGADLSGGCIVDSTCNGSSFRSSCLAQVETAGSSFERSELYDARQFWGSHEIITEILWRHIQRDDVEAVKLVSTVLRCSHWCYSDWHRYLTAPGRQRYYALARKIFQMYPRSGALEALEHGWDWRGGQQDASARITLESTMCGRDQPGSWIWPPQAGSLIRRRQTS